MKTKSPIALFVAWLALGLGPADAVRAEDATGASAIVQQTGSITGRILNVTNDNYLEKARVTIEGTSLEAFTDSTGEFRLNNVPAGSVQVKAFYTGLAAQTQTVTVTANQATRQDFDLVGFQPDHGGVVKLGEVVVSASREMSGAAIAINEQRFASNIMHVVAADEFGDVPDGSVGEFLKFIPGVNIDYTGGVANSISIDGVPSNNVPVTIGGFDLASAGATGIARSVELLQVPLNSVARVEVSHSPTPESPGAALAGSINMVPRGAFERSRPLFNGRAYLMMRDNARSLDKTPGPRKDPTHKVLPGFDFSYIVPVNQRFGFTLSGSASTQYTPGDRMQNTWAGVGARTNPANNLPNTTPDKPYLITYAVADDTKFNTRFSVGGTIDYKISPNDVVSFAFQYGNFGTESISRTLSFFVNGVAPGNFTTTSTHGMVGLGEVRMDTLNARAGTRSIYMPTLVYRHNGPTWKAEAGAGHSKANTWFHDLDQGAFERAQLRRTNVTVSFDDIFYLRPRVITVTDGTTGDPVDPYNINNYVLTTATANDIRVADLQRSAYANLRRDFDLRGIPISLKGGLDVRNSIRDSRIETTPFAFVGADGRATTTPNTPLGSDDGAGVVLDENFSQRIAPYGFGRIQWVSPEKAADLYQAHPGYFTRNENTSYRNRVANSKRAEEIISSVYLRGDVALFNRRLRLVGGLRVEQTNVTAEGPLTDPTRNFQRDPSGEPILGANGRPLPILPASDAVGVSKLTFIDRGLHAEKEYLRLFPNINVSYNVRENLIARAAYYYSLGRPNFNQYAGGLTLPDTELPPAPNNRITVNNVGIKAWSARTTKVRLEYYFERIGQVSVGAFRRDFENFFGSTVFNATPQFLGLYGLDPAIYDTYDVATQYNIESTVRMEGLEFDYKQSLTFLPFWARGVQAFANASTLRALGAESGNFAGFIPQTYNWGISLRRANYNLQMNWNYRGRQRRGIVAAGTSIEPGTYNWGAKRLYLDIQGEYYFWKRFALFANLRNLNDEPEDIGIYGPSTPEHARFRQRSASGSLWTFGIKGSF
ncbi:MAG: TonB-dependent receptor [Opitutaceae bacterium]|nr:TonB-dependent receptor [Opitutaceae bacterium]